MFQLYSFTPACLTLQESCLLAAGPAYRCTKVASGPSPQPGIPLPAATMKQSNYVDVFQANGSVSGGYRTASTPQLSFGQVSHFFEAKTQASSNRDPALIWPSESFPGFQKPGQPKWTRVDHEACCLPGPHGFYQEPA